MPNKEEVLTRLAFAVIALLIVAAGILIIAQGIK